MARLERDLPSPTIWPWSRSLNAGSILASSLAMKLGLAAVGSCSESVANPTLFGVLLFEVRDRVFLEVTFFVFVDASGFEVLASVIA